MHYLGIFEVELSKNYSCFWNQPHRICLIAKFSRKRKISKFETKSALFGYFWARIRKNYCHIWNQCSWIFLIAKFWKKATKVSKCGAKNALFGTSGIELEKAIVISESNTLEFHKKQSWTHTVNFGIGSGFSEGPVPSPGPFLKVCRAWTKNDDSCRATFKCNTCPTSCIEISLWKK